MLKDDGLRGNARREAGQAALLKALVEEIALTGRLKPCDRVVRLLGSSSPDAGTACLIMELVPGGSLHDLLYCRPKLRQLTYLEILQVRYAAQARWLTCTVC